jgi:hypothetical protein
LKYVIYVCENSIVIYVCVKENGRKRRWRRVRKSSRRGELGQSTLYMHV